MFPSVWSSLLMVNKQALGTLVSLLMVIDLEAQVSVGRGLGRLETDGENFGQGGRGMGGNWQPSRNPL